MTTADGAAAREMIQGEDAPALAILDWMMPGPVVAITPVPERLWVWHDAAFELNAPFGVGVFDALPHR